jgi:hypothetical protein
VGVKVRTGKRARITQGDIIRDVEYIEYASAKSGNMEISKIIFPLVIVLTQDCDLSLDYKYRWSKAETKNEDKWLLSVLVAPLYNVEHIYTGEHLHDIGMEMVKIKRNGTQGNNLKNNEIPRYHYLEFPSDISTVSSVIDFKHYFSVNVAYLKKLKNQNSVCALSELYREDVVQRFSSYLSRIGLP